MKALHYFTNVLTQGTLNLDWWPGNTIGCSSLANIQYDEILFWSQFRHLFRKYMFQACLLQMGVVHRREITVRVGFGV